MSLCITYCPGGLRKVQKKVSIPRKKLRKRDAPGSSLFIRDQPRGFSLGADQQEMPLIQQLFSPWLRSDSVNIVQIVHSQLSSQIFLENKLRHLEIKSLRQSQTDHEQLIRVSQCLFVASDFLPLPQRPYEGGFGFLNQGIGADPFVLGILTSQEYILACVVGRKEGEIRYFYSRTQLAAVTIRITAHHTPSGGLYTPPCTGLDSTYLFAPCFDGVTPGRYKGRSLPSHPHSIPDTNSGANM